MEKLQFEAVSLDSYQKWLFSIAMLDFWRVSSWSINK